MADDFGLKIGIGGKREFKNAIREINQSFKMLGSEMNLVASQFDKQDKSLSMSRLPGKSKIRSLGGSLCPAKRFPPSGTWPGNCKSV